MDTILFLQHYFNGDAIFISTKIKAIHSLMFVATYFFFVYILFNFSKWFKMSGCYGSDTEDKHWENKMMEHLEENDDIEYCDCGKPATKRSHAYNWVACDDCVDEKLLEDLENI